MLLWFIIHAFDKKYVAFVFCHCLHAKCFSKGTYSTFNGCTANVLYYIAMNVEKLAADSCNHRRVSNTIFSPLKPA